MESVAWKPGGWWCGHSGAGTAEGWPAEAGFDPSHPARAPAVWLGSSPQGGAPRRARFRGNSLLE